jgi:Helix-turn-helix domain
MINLIEVIIFPDGRMDTANAAEYLGLSQKTLAMMRCQGTGPKYIKRGRIFYFKDDLDAWINQKGKRFSTVQDA